MRNINGEHQGFPTLAVLVPIGDDIADKIVPVHAVGELIDGVVALPGFNTLQVRLDRSVIDRRHEVLLLDELGDLRPLDDDVEEVAEASTVGSARCSGQSEPLRIGILARGSWPPRLSAK